MDLMTIEEVAGLLRVSRHTVYRLVSRGEIPGHKVGRHWRFMRDEVVDHLRRRTAERTASCMAAAGGEP